MIRMKMLLMLLNSLPMGDDTPIVLFIVIGVLALLLMIGCVVLSRISKNKK